MTIESNLNNLDNTKAAIKQAIIDKGVTVSSSDTFSTYPSKIAAIPDASEYIGYLNDIEDVLDDAGVTVPASYADLDTTIENSYGAISEQLSEISGGESHLNELRVFRANFWVDTDGKVYNIGEDENGQIDPMFEAWPYNLTEVDSLHSIADFYSDDYFDLVKVDMSNVTTISGSGVLEQAFRSCSKLVEFDLSNLVTVSGADGMFTAFASCSNLTSINFPKLTMISGSNCLASAFSYCDRLVSATFPALTSVTGNSGMNYIFEGCPLLEQILFPSLSSITGSSSLAGAFSICESLSSLSFPSLNSNSFGSYTNQFYNMLNGVTGCTVHFPSNLQSVIGNWTDVTNGFGGTNTTVLFDLPATT